VFRIDGASIVKGGRVKYQKEPSEPPSGRREPAPSSYLGPDIIRGVSGLDAMPATSYRKPCSERPSGRAASTAGTPFSWRAGLPSAYTAGSGAWSMSCVDHRMDGIFDRSPRPCAPSRPQQQIGLAYQRRRPLAMDLPPENWSMLNESLRACKAPLVHGCLVGAW
jgi:hypothetical protein